MWRQAGFSLVEILFTLAIVAILAAIAIPSYQAYIRETRLYEAKGVILQNVYALERYYARHYRFKKNSTTWADIHLEETDYFCVKFQGNPRGVKGDKFTLKAVAKNKNHEPRSIMINDDQQMQVCENTSSTCEEKNYFVGNRTDTGCRFL